MAARPASDGERRPLRLIGVPMDLGADRRGVDMGPSAVRYAGFHDAVKRLGYTLLDGGDVYVPTPEERSAGKRNAKYLKEITAACEEVRQRVLKACEAQETPIVVGGDHSIAVGTVTGISEFYRRQGEKIGLLWIDAHADMNTPETSPSGNVHGMPLACCIGLGPKELSELGGFSPKVSAKNVVLLGIRDLDRREKDIVRASGVNAYTMRDIDERGLAGVVRDALDQLRDGTCGFHCSLDMDALDPSLAPGVGTPVRGGLRFREAHLILELVADSGAALSFEVTEINPMLDQKNTTAEVAVDLLLSGLGKSIL